MPYAYAWHRYSATGLAFGNYPIQFFTHSRLIAMLALPDAESNVSNLRFTTEVATLGYRNEGTSLCIDHVEAS